MTQPAETEPTRFANSVSAGDGSTGDIVQVGYVAGDFHYGGSGAAKSWYLGKVRELAPDELVGRETELAELKRFCLADDSRSCAWWRADAWSGKTALMASFVLDPPEEVRLVAFFVRAADTEADSRAGFLTEVNLQLAEVLGIPLPENTGASGFPGLLDAAAEACARRGQRLILIVDGLDEDRGAGDNDGAGSIAALLPRRPAHGMRIIVTGRPNPGIPPALHPDHPLRDPAIVRELVSSSAASAAELALKGDLDRLLGAEADEARDVLGFLVTARGGLSRDDLVELAGQRADAANRILDSVEGRAFSRRRARWHPGPEVYVLAHEGLQARAAGRFGRDGLQTYRDRLMAWADEYRDRGWPVSTPQFLLLGYPRLLQETGQLQRLVECVTDLARQERLLAVSGGEAAAQAEIAAAHAEVSTSAQPDVLGLLKLSMHRDDLEARNARTPARLPALWARLGEFDRAEALARSISEPGRRADAVFALVEVLVPAGQADRAERIVAEVVDEAGFPTVTQCLVTELAATGDLPRAMALAEAIPNPGWRRRAVLALSAPRPLTDVASMLAAADEISDTKARTNTRYFVARRLIEQGEAARAVAVAENFDPPLRAGVIKRAARRLRDDSKPEEAADLVALAGTAAPEIEFSLELEDLAHADLGRAKEKVFGLTDPTRRERNVGDLIELAISQDSVDFAESLLEFVSPVNGRRGLFLVLESLAAHNEAERAMELLANKSEEWRPYARTEIRAAAMTVIAEGLLKAGDASTAENLASDAESVARSLGNEHGYKQSFRRVADFVVAANDVPAAERFARITLASGVERHIFSGIAELLAESGDMELAEHMGLRLDSTFLMAKVMVALLRRHRVAGAEEEVCRVVQEFGGRVAETPPRESEMPRVVEVYCAAGLPGQALEIARNIEEPHARKRACESVVKELCKAGRIQAAVEIVCSQAGDEAAASRLTESLAEGMGAAGYVDGLEVLAGLGVQQRPREAVIFLERLAEHDLERALHLAGTSLQPFWRSSALVAMAGRVGEPARSRLLAEVAQSNDWPSVLPALRPGEHPGVAEVVDQFIRLQEARVGLELENG
ncbi:hypothetical protein [Amycolatopsis vancoresmycina]|uniref:Uncharacterized protein n=1 Tax=Amycolatopsis vancoresmycina DSM 44592 TaxID=1292037 RepID=R1G8B8_9PSEU|nr:hypothetical protein [Amycolatopsis vancoresmycina]EOD67662.1 hypothetical protein H480_15386 [Amycolatopsis vancoresmycina DSM 44592]